MFKRIAVAVSAAAIATVGLGVAGSGVSGAAGPVMISCTSLGATVNISPPSTLTPAVSVTTVTKGKLKGCTGVNLPAGVSIKGGTASGTIATGAPGTCDLAEIAGVSENDITLTTTWKTKPANALAPTTVVFSNRSGFTLPAPGGTTTVTGTGAGSHIKVVGDAAPGLNKIIKSCYGKDLVAGGALGKGVAKIKVYSGTLTSALSD